MGKHSRKKVILVTGASRGIGRSLVELLASRPDDFQVYGTYHSTFVKEGEVPGATFLAMDQTSYESICNVVQIIHSREQRLDMLVNNAGIGIFGPLEALSGDDIRRQLQVNVEGPLLLMKEVLPLMRANRFGRIINVSSTTGLAAIPFMDIYCGSKFALEGVSAAIQGYVGLMGDGADIQCRVVEPGYTKTEFCKRAGVPEVLPNIYTEAWQGFCKALDDGLIDAQPVMEVAKVILDMLDASGGNVPYRWQTHVKHREFLEERGVDTGGRSVIIPHNQTPVGRKCD